MSDRQVAIKGRTVLTGPGIYKTFYWMDPATGIAGTFSTQCFNFGDPTDPQEKVYNQLERALYDGLQ